MKDGIIQIKKSEFSKPFKVYHINLLYNTFPDFEFFDDDWLEFFYDAPLNVSGQSTY